MNKRNTLILGGVALALVATVAVRDARANAFEVAKNAFCGTLGVGLCDVVDLVVAVVEEMKDPANKNDLLKAFESLWNKFKKKVEKTGEDAKAQLDGLFKGLRTFLTIPDAKDFPAEAWEFAKKVFNTVNRVTESFTTLIRLPQFIGALLGVINGATVTVTVAPAVIGLALVNLGARKLFEWLLPELILGTGAMVSGAIGSRPQTVSGTDAAAGGAPATAPPGGDLFQTILGVLRQYAGPIAGGLIGILVKDETKKKRILAVLEKIADVAGKIEKGLGAVLSLSDTIAKGKFDDVEKAIAGAGEKSVPQELTPKQVLNMMNGLLDFAKDEIWALVHPPLGNVLGKGLSLLDNLLGIPRGILIAAIGIIPFVGATIASALNFGLGIVVGLIKDLLIGEIMGLAKFILDDVMEGVKKSFRKRLFKEDGSVVATLPAATLTEPQQRIRAAVQRSTSVAALAASMGNAVDGVRQSLKAASLHHQSTVRALVMTAMKDVLLRGVASTHVRERVTAALAMLAPRFTEPGFSLAKGIGALLSQLELPLAELLLGTVANSRIRQLLRKGLSALVRDAATERGAARLGRSEEGVLTRLGADLIERVRPELVALLVGAGDHRALRGIVAREVDALARTVQQKGFGALLRFGELLRRAVSRATKPLLRRALAHLEEPVRYALADDLDALSSQIADEIVSGSIAGKNLLIVIAENAGRTVTAHLTRDSRLGAGVAAAAE